MAKDKNSMPWDGHDIPEEHADEDLSFPFIQWVHGTPAMKQVHPVLGTGGFAMPTTQFGAASATGEVPDFFTQGTLVHHNGDETPAFLAHSLSIAVIGTRFCWVGTHLGRSAMSSTYFDNARGKRQILCLVKGVDTIGPVMITIRGTSSGDLGTIIRDFRQQIVAPAQAIGKRKFPLYAFWMTITAGPRQERGESKKSFITPPVPGWDRDKLGDLDSRRDVLRNLYVGSEVIEQAKGLWQTGQDWMKAWSNLRLPQEVQNAATPYVDTPPPPEEYEEEIPF